MAKQSIAQTCIDQANELLQSMTLAEKAAQLGSYGPNDLLKNGKLTDEGKKRLEFGLGQVTRLAGGSDMSPQEAAAAANEIQGYLRNNTRLGIPALFHEECLSGLMVKGGTTFPQILGQASAFDPELVRSVTDTIRQQMRTMGAHLGLSPVLDLARDLRWGRVEETFGEDAYLTASLTTAYVLGLQGDNLQEGAAATLKHFAGHGVCEGGRNHSSVNVSRREMMEQHLFPFQAGVVAGGALSVMNAYHDWDGIPCASSGELLTEILRNDWGFAGIVVSDYWAIPMLHTDHKTTANAQESGVAALTAGLDVELPDTICYGDKLVQAVQSGLLDETVVDTAVLRHLALKFALGIFDQPMVTHFQEQDHFETVAHREQAREAARRSMVLLKNEGGLLPLTNDLRSLAVVGPNAASTRNLLGDYAYSAHVDRKEDAVAIVSILDGLKEQLPETSIRYAQGCGVLSGDAEGIQEAVEAASQADLVIAVVGGRSGLSGVNVLNEEEKFMDGSNIYRSADSDGEFQDRTDLHLPGVQQQLVEAVVATGKPVIVVLVNGRPLSLPWIAEHVPAVVEAWLPGEEGGRAVADVLLGRCDPGGRLPVSIPKSVGQLPVHYNRRYISQHRGYITVDAQPLYPFGFGLSYSEFAFSDLEVSWADERMVVGMVVENTGSRSGRSVPQLYVRDDVASRTRPIKELKGFVSLALEPGERRRIEWDVPLEVLSFVGKDYVWRTEPGEFTVMIGHSSADIALSQSLTLEGEVRTYKQRTVFFSSVAVV